MRYLVGLGNPGKEYEQSRHNAGFQCLDYLRESWGWPSFKEGKKFSAALSRQGGLTLCKPLTYMNDSGQAVRSLLHFYESIEDFDFSKLIVAHDDLDLELGQCKVQRGRGPKGHNGLLSLYQQLGTSDFYHLRLGVDSRKGDRSMPSRAYVLQNMQDGEQQDMSEAFERARDILQRELSFPAH